MNTIMDDERVERGARLIRPYGEPVAFVPVALQTTAEGEAALFRVTFATETLTWLVRLGPGQTVNGFVLRHSPNHRIYSVFTRLIEGY